ncbi:hypothetical protein [Leifsonia sp. SIMBA_070]|uniref:DUF7927 domain-containing protein n=4 Tax=Bacteria TaxID=2 RepID=UPI00397E1DC9
MRARNENRGGSRHRASGTRKLVFATGTRTKAMLAAVLSVGLLASGLSTFALVGAVAPASAAPGTPGTPQANTVVFQEGFENGVANAPVGLAAYSGANGEKYTADAAWLSGCNGQVRNMNTPSTTLGNCLNEAETSNLGQLAYALGANNGSATPAANHAVTAYTEGNPGTNAVEFRTVSNLPLASASGRFLTFSVDTAAVNCQVSAPQYQFAFVNQAGTATNVGGVINACSSNKTVNVPAYGSLAARAINVGSYTSNGSVLFTGSTLGIRMTNANGSGVGNDAAFDNIRILDVTPQLDKSFSPASIYSGQTSTLTFTVTNTAELAAKNGWSFTDNLPAGVTLASPTAAATTCPAGAVTAAAGGTTVGVTGNLTAGMTSCTVTVNVTSTTPGSYTNGPANVTETGLNPPADTTLTVATPPVWTCDASGYLFQSTGGPSSAYKVDLVSGAYTTAFTLTDTVNATAYNTTDNYMYAYSSQKTGLVKIASDGSIIPLPTPTGFPATAGYTAGEFDSAGHFWIVRTQASAPWVEIDYAAGSPTYGTIIAQGTLSATTDMGADWVYSNGALYSINPSSHFIKFDTTTHVSTDLGLLPNVPTGLYGAGYADAAGNLYYSNNATGEIYRVNPTTKATILVSTGPAAGGNDGARCATAPIPTITVVKNVGGRVQPADQFTVGLNNAGGTTLTSATTTGTNTTAATTNWPVSQGSTYTITDAMAAGSPDALSSYAPTIVCVDGNGNPATTGGASAAWTLTVAAATAYTCTVTNSPNQPAFTVSKSASAASVKAGSAITYTVTVTNTGTVPFTAANPASFTDNLARVLDDAAYNGDASNGASVNGNILSWSGPLAVGATATITYSVTVRTPDNGDHILTNAVVPGTGGSCVTAADCTTNTPVQSFSVTKTADANQVTPGNTITYTITVANTGQTAYTAGDPASWSDDLTSVLDDATYNGDVTGGATYSAPTLAWSGALPIGATVTFTYSVTVNTPDSGDQILRNAVVTPVDGGCPAGSTDPACFVQIPSGSYTVAKSASTTSVLPGDTITYTVVVTNTGNTDYTAAEPASFTDDLSGVLDDAAYNGDASNGATVTGTNLNWSGALPIGQTVTVTYSVTVNDPDTGDKAVHNTVRPTAGGGVCDAAGDCSTTTAVRTYSVTKTSNPAGDVHVGDVVTYTVTVSNTGTGDFTAGSPASFSDDLSHVLDDAVYNGDATGGATVTGNALSWSGPLAVGATTTVTYSVTVASTPIGDKVLTNAVVPGDGGECVAPGDCATTNDVASFTVSKTSSPSGPVTPGTKVTYTVTVTNTGTAAYTTASPASFTDDLTAVIDDATYNGDANNGATYAAPTLSWSGPLAVGATRTVTYSVTVNSPDSGDHVLNNAVVPNVPGGECDPTAECSTSNPVRSYSVDKAASTTVVTPGNTVTYTVTVTNTGQTDYTAAAPASFHDDLTAVLDDAAYNGDASNGATVSGVTLSWSGPLAIGATQVITYSVTVKNPDNGDHVLTNAVVPDGPGGDCATAGGCTTTTAVRSYTATKTADTNVVNPGGVITYTVTLVNTGTADYTAATPATFTDDLTGVLDDATYDNDATGGATYAAPTLSWSGPLPVGQTVTVTYSVTVNDPDTGDSLLPNTVVTGDGGNCAVGSNDPACTVLLPSASFTVSKTASSTTVDQGGRLTYTVTVKNTGQVDYTTASPASFTDDLSAVLDDATYNGDASNGATVTGTDLTWSGPLAAGATLAITYSVTAKNPDTGDKVLNNFVRPTAPGGDCTTDCATTTPVRALQVAKTVDSTHSAPGTKLTYTITVTNTGGADYTTASPARFTDDLSAVLDDASYGKDATGGATYAAPVLSWSGPLAIGAVQTVTYSVTVSTPDLGDHVLRNAVVAAGSNCATGSKDASCSTSTTVTDPAPLVPPTLASTGIGNWLSIAGLSALALIGAGLAVAFATRRRRNAQ